MDGRSRPVEHSEMEQHLGLHHRRVEHGQLVRVVSSDKVLRQLPLKKWLHLLNDSPCLLHEVQVRPRLLKGFLGCLKLHTATTALLERLGGAFKSRLGFPVAGLRKGNLGRLARDLGALHDLHHSGRLIVHFLREVHLGVEVNELPAHPLPAPLDLLHGLVQIKPVRYLGCVHIDASDLAQVLDSATLGVADGACTQVVLNHIPHLVPDHLAALRDFRIRAPTNRGDLIEQLADLLGGDGLVTFRQPHVRGARYVRNLCVDIIDSIFDSPSGGHRQTERRDAVARRCQHLVVMDLSEHIGTGVQLDTVLPSKVVEKSEDFIGVSALANLPQVAIDGERLLRLQNVVHFRLAAGCSSLPAQPFVGDVEEAPQKRHVLRVSCEGRGNAVIPEGTLQNRVDGVLSLGDFVSDAGGFLFAQPPLGEAGAGVAHFILHELHAVSPVVREQLAANPRLDAIHGHIGRILESHLAKQLYRRLRRVVNESPRLPLGKTLGPLDHLVALGRLGGADG